MEKKKERLSGIELLKIIAIILIVISHVTQTLEFGKDSFSQNVNNYSIEISKPTASFNTIILATVRQFGALGNLFFVISSIWFIIDKNKNYKHKIISLMTDILVISIIFLVLFLFLYTGKISFTNIKQSILPTIFQSNWFMTCYIFLLLLSPFLNIILNKINQKQLLRINIFNLFVYFGICFINKSLLYYNKLINFIVIYYFIAYIKKYCKEFTEKKKINYIMLVSSSILMIASVVILNFIEIKLNTNHFSLTKFADINNIILLVLSISAFNIFKNMKFVNNSINYISSLSMLIYIIHENLLVRSYLRPKVWTYLLNKYGENYIILEDIIFSIVVLIVSIILSIIYKLTIQRLTSKLSDYIYNKSFIRKTYLKIEEKVLKLK